MILKRKTFSTTLVPDEVLVKLKDLEQHNKSFRVIRKKDGSVNVTCNTLAPKGIPVMVGLSFHQQQVQAVFGIDRTYLGLTLTLVVVWFVIGLFLFLPIETFILMRESLGHFQAFYPFAFVFLIIMSVGLVWNNLIEAESELHRLFSS